MLDAATVAAVGGGRTTVIDATLAGRITVDGDPVAIEALVAAFASTTPA